MNTEEGHGWLVEWDGGWETAASPGAAEKIVEGKIAEWGDADRGEFRIVPNVPPTDDMEDMDDRTADGRRAAGTADRRRRTEVGRPRR